MIVIICLIFLFACFLFIVLRGDKRKNGIAKLISCCGMVSIIGVASTFDDHITMKDFLLFSLTALTIYNTILIHRSGS